VAASSGLRGSGVRRRAVLFVAALERVRCTVEVQQLEAQRLDPLEHGMQLGVVADASTQHGLDPRLTAGQPGEACPDGRAQPPAQMNLVCGGRHATRLTTSTVLCLPQSV
jgi:hypothetical protein